jgi:hypothetical protein
MSTSLTPTDLAQGDLEQGDSKQVDLRNTVSPAAALKLAERFGITEANLADRRAFIGLNEEDQSLKLEFADWAKSVSIAVSKDLLEHQFAFTPTRLIVERRAKSKGINID